MPDIWYYGDQRITGNYTQQQDLTLSWPVFYSVNVLTASTTSNIGKASALWDNLYVNSANVLVLQTSSLATLNVNTPSTPGSPYIANIFGNVYTSNSISALSANMTTLNTGTLSLLSISRTLGLGTATPPAATLWIGGNAFVSGILTAPNVFSTNINTISINTTSLVTSMTSLSTSGNAIFTNALTTSNIFATSANVVQNVTAANLTTVSLFSNLNSYSLNTSSTQTNTLSIGTYDPYTQLNINGNAYISNALTVPTLFASKTVVQTFSNVLFFPGPVGINTFGDSSTGAFVSGNVFASNSIVTQNIFSSTVSCLTINAASINFKTLTISFNPPISINPLISINGNAYVSNSATAESIMTAAAAAATANAVTVTSPIFNVTTDIIPTSTIPVYIENLTRRSPYLVPSVTNGPIIQAWISATCNASSQPQRSYWLTDNQPIFSNTLINPTPYYYKGAVLIPDGRVLFVPFKTTSPGFYQPKTLTFSTASTTGLPSGNFAYGVLLSTGNVVFCPQTSNVGMYNPLTAEFSNCASLPGGSYSGTLSPTGNVIFTPTGVPSNIIHWNYTTGIQKNCYSFSSAVPPTNPWSGVTTTVYTSTGSTRISTTWSDELGIFCVVSYGGGVSGTSADGLNWTFGPTGGMNGTCTGVVWVPELKIFCTISTNQPTPFVSRDGLNWTSGQNLSFQAWGSIAWSPQLGIFCIIGTNISAVSKDGLIWTEKLNTALSGTWPAITWSPQLGIFCALNMVDSGTVSTVSSATSPDGQNWKPGGSYITSSPSTGSIAWSPQLGIFCASASAVGTSTDGLLWNYATISSTSPPYSIDWSSQLGLFCMVSTNSSSGPYVMTSMNGVSWDLQYNTPFGSKTGYTSVTWSPGLGIFSVILSDGNYLYSTISSSMRSAIQSGSILLPNGNVLTGSPGTSNIIQYDPVTLIGSNLYVGTAGFNGLVLTPNGNVIGVPQNSNVLVINPSSFTSSNVTVPSVFFGGGCLTPSGNIIFAPSVSSSNVGMFDPVTLTYSNSTPTGASFSSATLVPNGQVVFSGGVLDTMTPVPIEFCLNPYLNKF